MDSIRIPIPIIDQLHNTARNSENENGFYQLDEPLLLHLKHPSASAATFQRTNTTTSCCDDNVCLIVQNVIPKIIPSNTVIKDASLVCNSENGKEPNEMNIINLHPIVEKFVITWCDSMRNDQQDSVSFELSKEDSSSSSYVNVWLYYIHPPAYYINQNLLFPTTNNNKNLVGNSNEDDSCVTTRSVDDDVLLERKVSVDQVYLKRIQKVVDIQKSLFPTPNSQQQQWNFPSSSLELQLDLQYIFCTHEGYEEWFQSIGKANNNQEKNNNSDYSIGDHQKIDQQQQRQHQSRKQQKDLLNEYLHQVLCQELEYKIIKKNMILPILLPPYPHNPNYDYNYRDDHDDEIVVFFQLKNITWKMRRDENNIHVEVQELLDSKKAEIQRNVDVCYKLGSINDNNDVDDDDEFHIDGDDHHEDPTNELLNNNSLNVALHIIPPVQNEDKDKQDLQNNPSNEFEIKCKCPGYESLLDEVVSLANIPLESAAPTAVLLVGCPGVGKSRLASSVADELRSVTTTTIVKTISAKDILLQASSSILDIEALKGMIVPTKFNVEKQYILIIDDIDVVLDFDDDGEGASSTYLFDEKRASLHAILESIDYLVKQRKASNNHHKLANVQGHSCLPFIFGICCTEQAKIPSSLNRCGRFEKIIEMNPPTELQRQKMLKSMLAQLPIINYTSPKSNDKDHESSSKDKEIDLWSKALARTTPGCVASDLKKICMDALTRFSSRNISPTTDDKSVINDSIYQRGVSWEDMSEAARSCIPSQLAQLDVTIPRDLSNQLVVSSNSSSSIRSRGTKDYFEQSWQCFNGYQNIKADLYRTVYRPWCRRHYVNEDNVQNMSKLEMEVPPPSGILFHGPSGTGKTYAVDCLAMSLGLNMVKVRASDILDQWLGGSEAAIRSIFSRSRSASPCLLLFDELDALATNREDDNDDSGGGGSSSDLYSRLLSTLLNEMDGVNSNINSSNNALLVVGTTNRIHAIDPALLRPGRFEKHIHLKKPTIEDIQDIMNQSLSKVLLLDEKGDLVSDLSEILHELSASGADVQGICRESCLIAMRKIDDDDDDMELNDVHVCKNDFEEAIQLWKKD